MTITYSVRCHDREDDDVIKLKNMISYQCYRREALIGPQGLVLSYFVNAFDNVAQRIISAVSDFRNV